jgi:hypothetical protein
MRLNSFAQRPKWERTCISAPLCTRKAPQLFFPLYFSVPHLPDGWKPVKGSFSPALSLSLSLSLIFFSSHFFLFIFTRDETYAGWMHDEIQTTLLL